MFLRTQYKHVYCIALFTYQTVQNVGGGEIWTVNTRHLPVLDGFHTSQLILHVISRVSNKCGFSYNYFVTGKMNNVNILFPVIHEIC